jgi:hypothetical protein
MSKRGKFATLRGNTERETLSRVVVAVHGRSCLHRRAEPWRDRTSQLKRSKMTSFHWPPVFRYVALISFAVFPLIGKANAQSSTCIVNASASSSSVSNSSSTSAQFKVVGDLMEADRLLSASAADGIGSSRYGDERSGGPFRRMANYLEDHIALDLGAGFNAPIGNDIPYITWGGNFTIGGGVHVNKRATLLVEYQFIGDKLPGGLIAEAGTQGGHAHIWSFTLDPVIDLFPERANSLYLTGGGGFYRKVTSFTEPGEYQNYVVGHFSSNQGGASFGFGVTHKMRWETNMRVFAEARYLFLNTPPITATNGLGTTGLIPVTIGVRW